MFKKLSKKLFGGQPSTQPSDGFFLNVRCSNCGETFKLFINKSFDLGQNYRDDGNVTYFLKKEIIGAGCRNRIHVKIQFDTNKKMVSEEIENGEFIEE
jgi:hypothetical protein